MPGVFGPHNPMKRDYVKLPGNHWHLACFGDLKKMKICLTLILFLNKTLTLLLLELPMGQCLT